MHDEEVDLSQESLAGATTGPPKQLPRFSRRQAANSTVYPSSSSFEFYDRFRIIPRKQCLIRNESMLVQSEE